MPSLLEAKNAGNNFAGEKNYLQAIVEYSKGLDDPSNNGDDGSVRHLLLGNRALCHMELQDYKKGLDDALAAVAINSKYVKGWYRAGVCAEALGDQDPEDIATYFQKCVELDRYLFDAKNRRDEALSLNENRNYLVMVSISNAHTIFRQTWFDCGLRKYVKNFLQDNKNENDSEKITKFLREKFQDLVLPTRNATPRKHSPSQDSAAAATSTSSSSSSSSIETYNYIVALLPRFNLQDINSVESLLDFVDSELAVNSGFDVVQKLIVDVQEKCNEISEELFGDESSTKKKTDDDQVAPIYKWFIEHCVVDENEETNSSNNKNSEGPTPVASYSNIFAAHTPKKRFQYVYSMSGRYLKNVRESLTERVARIRGLKSEFGIVPQQNRRIGVRASQILVFDILLPLLDYWMTEVVAPKNQLLDSFPKHITRHFLNSSGKSIKTYLQAESGGVCATCLKKFVTDEKTKKHIKIIDCSACGATFFCSTFCRDLAVKDLGHNSVVQHDGSSPARSYACPEVLAGLARKWREDGNVAHRALSSAMGQEESELDADAVTSGFSIVANPDICTPNNVQQVFKIPPKANHPYYQQWVKIIKRCTNWRKSFEEDLYGDGDQSDVLGQMPGYPAGDLRRAWGEGMDCNPKFLSQFMNWCMEGQVKKLSAALAALPNDEARKKAVNRRETLLRLSPLMGVIVGARMHSGKVTPDCDHLAAAKLMMKCGTNLNAKDISGVSVVAHCCTAYASELSLKILIYMCDTYPDEVNVDATDRLGSYCWAEPLQVQRTDAFRTLLMVGCNPYRRGRLDGTFLLHPMTCPAETRDAARTCPPNGKLRKGDLVAIHSMEKSKHLNGTIGKIVERLVGGKYKLEIPENPDNVASGKTKLISIGMENVNLAKECPNCDKLSTLHELLCSTCRLGFCCTECFKEHSWCEDAEDATHLDIPEECFATIFFDKEYSKQTYSISLGGSKPVHNGITPKNKHFFLVKVQVPMEIPNPRDAMPYLTGQKKYTPEPITEGVMIYDATQTFRYVLSRPTLIRQGGAAQGAAFDKLINAIDSKPKAFFWAFLDEEKAQLKIDIAAQTPTVMW